MDGTTPGLCLRSVGYALLTQAVWLPVIGFNAWDTAQNRDFKKSLTQQQPRPVGVSTIGASEPLWRSGFPLGRSTGTVLNQPLVIARNGADPLKTSPRSIDDRPATTADEPLFRPYRGGLSPVAAAPAGRTAPKADPIARAFTRAELLGGSLGLDGLRSPLVPPLALAEQARLRASGDPYLPLPLSLRTPMRQAIEKLQPARTPQVQPARVANVPSARVSRPTRVPVAIQADGSVDILSGVDRAAIDDVREWSRRQPTPPRGTVTPAVVELHPLPKAEPVRPSALPAESLSRSQPAPAPEPQWTVVTSTTVAASPAPHPVPPPPLVAEVSAPTPSQVLQ